ADNLIYTTCKDKCKIKKYMMLISKINKLPKLFRILIKIMNYNLFKQFIHPKFIRPKYTNIEIDETYINELISNNIYLEKSP
ncbi:MAG: hypothetical protein II567_11510, partial [Candidatus Riflebacteria bacterium]|nr:hypothetical protein [Candidatus Riflebacteria bacterium]